jgi:flap endonuclease-1
LLPGSDGTLITQRFHFIPGKHPYQHIISWYRLAQELNENGVSGVAIFDGKDRNHAKAREVGLIFLFL